MKHLHDDPPMWVTGGQAGVAFGTAERTAARFTLLVGDVSGLFKKLQFERQQFQTSNCADPPDVEGIVYNTLNFLLTAQSLYDWFKKAMEQRQGRAFDKLAFDKLVSEKLPHQGLCRDIANTCKHYDFRDGLWPGGNVKLDYIPGDERLSATAVLIFEQRGGMSMSADSLLAVIEIGWLLVLRSEGFIVGLDIS